MEPFESAILPVLPLKETVIFPSTIQPLFVVRPEDMAAVENALRADKRIFVTAQKNQEVDTPASDDLFDVGCVAEILQVLRLPDGSAKILAEGIYIARSIETMEDGSALQALLVRLEVSPLETETGAAYMRTTLSLFETYAKFSDQVPEDLYLSITNLDDPLGVIYGVANYSGIRMEEKQKILEAPSLEEKFMVLNANLEKENQILDLEDQITSQVKTQIGQSQREYFLNEQLKVIERELGIISEEHQEFDELKREIEKAGMPREAREKAEKELGRLSRMAPHSPEATVVRTYLEWLIDVPWSHRTDDRIDLKAARRILDEDHYALQKVKERIVEYLAVVKLAGGAKGPILCFVGPPGVGKTSLARSIARCVGRQFVRISLGGVRDEAEIRGHRRTYIGALPGKIIQSMKKAATVNPVFLLDEIDKMSSDFRGDPAAALLEVLDPEQNRNFGDHYMEVEYDLSQVMFITTANTTNGIPLAMQDRMEIIRISGYTDLEKAEIAKRYLIPKAIKGAGLRMKDMSIHKAALMLLIRGYTRESGVRNLEREIQSLCRKTAMAAVEAQEEKKEIGRQKITPEKVREYLGPEPVRDQAFSRKQEIGNAIGLAWTEVGGALLHVEARVMPGKGNLTLTGKLGDVMKESAQTALSYIRSHADKLGIDPDFHGNRDIHIHLPEGAIPKDGPSAGITLAAALASALSGKAVRQDVGMTGEMTLRGKVLQVGGLKEKALAAYRHGLREIILPEDNMVELSELPRELVQKIDFIPVTDLLQVIEIAFGERKPSGGRGKSSRKKPARRRGSNRSRPSAPGP